MTVFRRLEALTESPIQVAITGAGFVARGLVHQLKLTPGMDARVLVARRPDRGVDAFEANGYDHDDIVVTDSPSDLTEAVGNGRRVVTSGTGILREVEGIDVMVEATGDVEYGAIACLNALEGGHHVVSLNYETEATVGPLIAEYARRRGLVYTGSDGDQPGVMMRLIEYVRGIGLDVVVAVNCKGFLDYHATPESIRPWSEKQGTSLKMTTAFTDGTKMNVENCCVANAAGLAVERRGMVGTQTTLDRALDDLASELSGPERVDYTLGGDFGSGIFVVGTGADADLAAPYLSYLKMGDGPWYLFYRPWHLVQFETPLSIAEAVLDGLATISPPGGPLTEVVAHAKRDLVPGRRLDEIGGWDHYGLIDNVAATSGQLPVGLAEGATVTRPVNIDEPISTDDVELDQESPIVRLWKTQKDLFNGGDENQLIESTWSRLKADHGL